MQWDSSLVDGRMNDKINKHFKSINDKRAADHKPTLTEILQGPNTPNQEAQGLGEGRASELRSSVVT
jgi:hypothetical protein